MTVLSVRLEKDIEEMLDTLMRKKSIQDKSAYVRSLLRSSLREDLIEELCQEVKDGKISTWKAAFFLNIPLSSFLDELGKRDISIVDDIDAEIKFADLK